jgi:hypothetical protein
LLFSVLASLPDPPRTMAGFMCRNVWSSLLARVRPVKSRSRAAPGLSLGPLLQAVLQTRGTSRFPGGSLNSCIRPQLFIYTTSMEPVEISTGKLLKSSFVENISSPQREEFCTGSCACAELDRTAIWTERCCYLEEATLIKNTRHSSFIPSEGRSGNSGVTGLSFTA